MTSMSNNLLVFHSILSPDRLRDVLQREADEEHWTIFSLSGFRGNHPLLLNMGVDTFRLRKRRYFEENFARYFYARFEPVQTGIMIEGRFDYPSYRKWFMRIWFSFAILITVLVSLMALSNVFSGNQAMNGDFWIELLAAPSFLFFGLLMFKFGRFLGKRDEEYILQFIQDKLTARTEEPYSK